MYCLDDDISCFEGLKTKIHLLFQSKNETTVLPRTIQIHCILILAFMNIYAYFNISRKLISQKGYY